jgi:hypothetical protein
MTNGTKVNLNIDTLLDLYNDYITLFKLFGEIKYEVKANQVMNKLRKY